MKFKGIKLKIDKPLDKRTEKLLKLRLEDAYAIYLENMKLKLSKLYMSSK